MCYLKTLKTLKSLEKLENLGSFSCPHTFPAQVSLHDELRQLSVMFAQGQAPPGSGHREGGEEVAGSEDGVRPERVSAVKVRILARQLTPLHSNGTGRERRASSLATAGEVGTISTISRPFPLHFHCS